VLTKRYIHDAYGCNGNLGSNTPKRKMWKNPEKYLEYLIGQSNPSKPLLVILVFILVVLLGVVDYLTDSEISFSIPFLIPICLVTWFTGGGAGVFISITCTVTWTVADMMVSGTYSNPAIPYWNATARLGLFLIVTYILSALKTALEREKKLARTDYLTGVANRMSFFELANIEINRSRRYKHPFTIAYMDIDNFKFVNDYFGHDAGDTLLRSVAESIRNNIRESDIIARLGGDEFAILMPETGYESSQVVIPRVQKNLLDIVQKNGWPVTFSIGVVTFISPLDSIDEVIKKADDLMYLVKKSGKNTISYEVLGGPITVAK
jgi:diguanylate cyclase (GGDEF)-like protein